MIEVLFILSFLSCTQISWRGLGVFKVSSFQSIFRTFEVGQHEQCPQHVFRRNFDL